MKPTADPPDPEPIFNLGLSFWRAKVLLSAVELGVFAALDDGPKTLEELAQSLGIASRGAQDFFDALVAQGLLTRSDKLYANSAMASMYLVPRSPSYLGGALEVANARLYPVWGRLTEALRTGLPQNEAKVEDDYYDNLGRDQERLRTFLRGMTGLSMTAAKAMAVKFPWRSYRTFVDIGGAAGALAVQLAIAHEHLTGINLDLPPVAPFFDEYVHAAGLGDRLRFMAADFFRDPFPTADVFIMGHVLHNWDLAQKRLLIQKAHDALQDHGAVVVYESLIDEERREHEFGMLMSLNMLLVTKGGFVFTGNECKSWMLDAGFKEARVEHLHGPDWMVVGLK